MAVEHYENFPVASWLCPPALRPAVMAIYWFARTADDLADEGDAPAQQRLQDLADYRADLLRVARGQAPSPRWAAVFDPLAVSLRRHALPVPLLDALLTAFEQDITHHRYETREEVLDYCSRSANPVGRLLLHLYGVRDDRSLAESDAVCSALQLINFWQDLSVDLPRDRLYIPLADCRREGVPLPGLLDGRHDKATRRLVADMVAWARQLMLEGAPLAKRLPGRVGWELRLVVQGGLRILELIEAMDHRTVERRPVIRRRDLPLLLWRAWRM
jgi:squalene synthase HpnC